MECPTCEESFDTEQGMRIHHGHVHDEKLPNRTCKGCESEFYDPKSRLEYCDDCNPNAGENNGNWKGATETADCKLCESEFSYYPSDKDGVYCPECVETSDEFLGSPYYEAHDIKRVEKKCEQCGNSMTVLQSDIDRGAGRFCSHDCLCTWLSDQWGDTDTVYNGDWWQVKRSALERDNHECQHCGATKDELGREPDVHHVIPVRKFDDPQNAHTLDNVVCLCRSCHRLAEIGKIWVTALTANE